MCWNIFFFHSYRNLSSLEVSKWGKLPQFGMCSHQCELELTWYTSGNSFVKNEWYWMKIVTYTKMSTLIMKKNNYNVYQGKTGFCVCFLQMKRNSECWNWDHHKNKQDILFIGVETCKLINCLSPKIWFKGTWELLALVRLLNTSSSWPF